VIEGKGNNSGLDSAILGDKRNKIEYRIVIEMTSKYVAEIK
jgi:hypothetical protein